MFARFHGLTAFRIRRHEDQRSVHCQGEASSEEEILLKLSDLPFVKNNYLDIDIIEVKPYRGFV